MQKACSTSGSPASSLSHLSGMFHEALAGIVQSPSFMASLRLANPGLTHGQSLQQKDLHNMRHVRRRPKTSEGTYCRFWTELTETDSEFMSSPKTMTLAFCSIAAWPGIIFLIWSVSPGKRRHRNGFRIPPLQQCLAIAPNRLSPVRPLCHSTTCLWRPMSVHKGCETRRDLTILAINAQDETKLARKNRGRNGRIEEKKEHPTGLMNRSRLAAICSV